MNQDKIKSLNQQIWDQKNWGFNKVAKLLEDELEKEVTIMKTIKSIVAISLTIGLVLLSMQVVYGQNSTSINQTEIEECKKLATYNECIDKLEQKFYNEEIDRLGK